MRAQNESVKGLILTVSLATKTELIFRLRVHKLKLKAFVKLIQNTEENIKRTWFFHVFQIRQHITLGNYTCIISQSTQDIPKVNKQKITLHLIRGLKI